MTSIGHPEIVTDRFPLTTCRINVIIRNTTKPGMLILADFYPFLLNFVLSIVPDYRKAKAHTVNRNWLKNWNNFKIYKIVLGAESVALWKTVVNPVMDATETDDEALIGDECRYRGPKPGWPTWRVRSSCRVPRQVQLILLCRVHHKKSSTINPKVHSGYPENQGCA